MKKIKINSLHEGDKFVYNGIIYVFIRKQRYVLIGDETECYTIQLPNGDISEFKENTMVIPLE